MGLSPLIITLFLRKGFEWKLSTDSTFTKTISSTVSNIFNIELNNLTPNSEYIYKAYVKIGDFIFYNEITFTTNDICYNTT